MKEVTMRCKAFEAEGVRKNRLLVDNETVRVWDAIAGHYTLCHSLSKRSIQRALKVAKVGK